MKAQTTSSKRLQQLTRNAKMIFFLSLFSVALIGCTSDQPVNSGLDLNTQTSLNAGSANLQAETTDDLLKKVKQATARFNSTTQAIRAGYEPDDHCVAVPGLGGMGFHWVNEDLLDENFDPLQPEVVLYEADKNGNLKLVAVEYIVLDVEQDHPHFGDYPFDIGGTPIPDDHYSLHVWLYKDNPNGIFTPFNPNITCH